MEKRECLIGAGQTTAPIHYTVVMIGIIESRTNELLNKKRCGIE
jgi:hypothetical protein